MHVKPKSRLIPLLGQGLLPNWGLIVKKAVFPSLEKEGWTRPQEEYRAATFLGADGVVGSNYR